MLHDKLKIWFIVTLLGQISLEEFIEGAEKDPWVMEQLKLDIGPMDWFIKQQEENPWVVNDCREQPALAMVKNVFTQRIFCSKFELIQSYTHTHGIEPLWQLLWLLWEETARFHEWHTWKCLFKRWGWWNFVVWSRYLDLPCLTYNI